MKEILFTKDFNEIQFKDVKNFFGMNLREGRRLDYKENFPKDLAKTIIAFANTSGGIILIGVKANNNTNLPEKIVGVPLTTGLEERVTNITMSNIRPPISPEVKVCPYKSETSLSQDDKAVIVVRVSQSDIAPHSDEHTNAIWVRNHNRCDMASLDDIERLLERRDAKTEIRKEMDEEVHYISTNAVARLPHDDSKRKTYFQIVISPIYPLKITFNKSIDEFLKEQINSVSSTNKVSPRVNGINFEFISNVEDKLRRFFSFHRTGFLINIEPLRMKNSEEVYAERVVQILAEILRASTKIYERFEYFGRLSIKVHVAVAVGTKIISLIPRNKATPFDDPRTCKEGYLQLEESRLLNEIKDNKNEILQSVYNSLLRAFQISLDDKILNWRLDYLLENLP